MKMKKVIGLILAAALACTGVLSGCGSEATTASENKDTTVAVEENKPEESKEETSAENDIKKAEVQELVLSGSSDPLTWDPALYNTIPDSRVQTLVYEGLTMKKLDENGQIYVAPAAAESWDISDDKTVYTFHLRDGLTWADGTPLTAHDFEYSWKRLFDPKNAAPLAWEMFQIEGAESAFKGETSIEDIGVKALDDKTFEVKLTKPDRKFLNFAGEALSKPVKKEQIEKYGVQYGAKIENIIGNGPFKAVHWEVGSKIEFEKNPNYWDAEHVYLDKITINMIQETSTLAQSLMSNEIDIAELNNPDWNDMVDQTGYYNIVECDRMNIEELMFNCTNKPFNNWKVRLAMSLSLDREAFSEEINHNTTAPLYGFTPAISAVNGESYSKLTGGKNEAIKDLLKKYPDPKALLMEGLKEEGYNDPSEITIEYNTRGTGEQQKKAAEWMKQAFESKLGIHFNINMTEWNVMYDMVDSGNYELANIGWSVDSGQEPSEFLDLYDNVDGYYAPQHKWKGPAADKYYELVQNYKNTPEDDTQARADAYLAAETFLCEYGPDIPLYATKSRTLVGKYVHGYTPHPMVADNYVGVWVEEK